MENKSHVVTASVIGRARSNDPVDTKGNPVEMSAHSDVLVTFSIPQAQPSQISMSFASLAIDELAIGEQVEIVVQSVGEQQRKEEFFKSANAMKKQLEAAQKQWTDASSGINELKKQLAASQAKEKALQSMLDAVQKDVDTVNAKAPASPAFETQEPAK